MGNPKSIYSFSYHVLVMLPFYWLIGKRILYNNIFKSYNMPDSEKIVIIKIGYRKGLQLLEILMNYLVY